MYASQFDGENDTHHEYTVWGAESSTSTDVAIRLLDVLSKQFEIIFISNSPQYAAVSYVWSTKWKDEVSFADIDTQRAFEKPGYQRFLAVCELTMHFGLRYLWCDSICINQDSGEEVSWALKWMPTYYHRAQVCLVYIPGFHEPGEIRDTGGTAPRQLSSTVTSNAHHFEFLALACRLEFCISEWRFKNLWTFRLLDTVTTAIHDSIWIGFPHRTTIFDMDRAKDAAWTPGKEGTYQRPARSPNFLVNGEGEYTRLDEMFSRPKQRLREETGKIAASPIFCGWTKGKFDQTHVDALKRVLRVFGKAAQSPVGYRIPQSRTPQIPGLDVNTDLSETVTTGFTHLGSRPGKIYDSNLRGDAESLIDMASRSSVKSGLSSWTHVRPSDFSRAEHQSSSPVAARSVTISLGQVEGLISEQINQTCLPNGQDPSVSQSELSNPIRLWLDSMYLGDDIPSGWAPDHSSTAELSLEHNQWHDDGSSISPDITGRNRNRWLCFEEWTNLESSLGPEHPFIRLKSSTAQDSLGWFKIWKRELQRSQENQSRRECQEKEQDGQLKAPPKTKEPLELACPYYKKDPHKYMDCLKRCRLKTIGDIKDHIWQQHRLPFYCPVCKKDFPTASNRDRHIVKRGCALQDHFPFEGVSDDQRRQLFRRYERKGGAKMQWLKIWKLLLPNEPPPASPALKDDPGQEIVVFREFWSRHGEALVARSVKKADLTAWDRCKEERDLASLYSEVLNEAVDGIVRGLDLSRSKAAHQLKPP